MNKKLHCLFKNMEEIEPPSCLKMAILSRIMVLKARKTRQKLMLSYAGLAFSIVAVVASTALYGQSFIHSEFWSVVSLVFSDAGTVASYWSNFLYSLLETFPTITFAIILTPVLTLFLSIISYIGLNSNNHHKYI